VPHLHSHHQPLESYLRAVEQAGMQTETIRETKVSSKLLARDPSERGWQRIPPFLQLRALNPARSPCSVASNRPHRPSAQRGHFSALARIS
jgi:hypothetical protein